MFSCVVSYQQKLPDMVQSMAEARFGKECDLLFG